MPTGCLRGVQHVVHTVQTCVRNCNLDHEKLGAKHTPTLVKKDAEGPKTQKGALRGTPPQAPEQGWLDSVHQYTESSGMIDEEA
eukprot:5973011-Lingulodinium_polyedra.AAC.1